MKKLILLLVLIVLISLTYIKLSSSSKIVFDNGTGEEITNLEIKLTSQDTWTNVGKISPNEKETFHIDYPKDFIEGSLELRYVDFKGEKHLETVVGYLEKGYKVNVKVKILEVSENGIYKLEIK
ncbi:MAG: hypothetical protein Q4E02_00165 [Lagierella massiliensis]|nr:hypothetical protein [Lagierella massiliensis]